MALFVVEKTDGFYERKTRQQLLFLLYRRNVTLTLVLGSHRAGPGVARDAAGAMHPPVLVSAMDGTSAGQ